MLGQIIADELLPLESRDTYTYYYAEHSLAVAILSLPTNAIIIAKTFTDHFWRMRITFGGVVYFHFGVIGPLKFLTCPSPFVSVNCTTFVVL